MLADEISTIIKAFKDANIETVQKYLSEEILLDNGGEDDIYGQEEVKTYLEEFFAANKTSAINLVHNGEKGDTQFFIVQYKSSKTYRIHFLLEKNQIIEIKIEE